MPRLIHLTRDLLRSFFDYWAIENVMGASSAMSESSQELFGRCFGLKVDRARKIEATFPVFVDKAVLEPGRALRRRTCLGGRRRWKRVDTCGRWEPSCCPGNAFAIQGTSPWRCTTGQCAEAMDMDPQAMAYDRITLHELAHCQGGWQRAPGGAGEGDEGRGRERAQGPGGAWAPGTLRQCRKVVDCVRWLLSLPRTDDSVYDLSYRPSPRHPWMTSGEREKPWLGRASGSANSL